MTSQPAQTQKGNTYFLLFIRVLFTFLLLGTILFIFSNSSQIGKVSGVRSQQATQWINYFFQRIHIGLTLSEHMVRKLGHFGEYTLLGFWLMLTLRVYTKRIFAFIAWPLLLGLLTAVLDEFYQSFVPGRGSQVTDIVIDFTGVVFGLAFGLFILLLCNAY